jgi:hypothetical protein
VLVFSIVMPGRWRGVVVMPLPVVSRLRHEGSGIRLRAVASFFMNSFSVMMRVAFGPMVRLSSRVALVPVVLVPVATAFVIRSMAGMVLFVVVVPKLRPRRLMVVPVALVRRAGNKGAHIHLCRRHLRGGVPLFGRSEVKVQSFLLLRHQVAVESACRDQLVVSPRLHQAPFCQHQDAVGIDHAGETVGNPQSGAAFHQPVQGLLNYRFIGGVHAGQRLV